MQLNITLSGLHIMLGLFNMLEILLLIHLLKLGPDMAKHLHGFTTAHDCSHLFTMGFTKKPLHIWMASKSFMDEQL